MTAAGRRVLSKVEISEMIDWQASILWSVVLTAVLWAILWLVRKLSR